VIVAFQYTNDKGESTEERAVVVDMLHMDIGVVCVCHSDTDEWEPVYMVRQKDGRIPIKCALPSCFSLNDEAIAALKHVVLIKHDESGEVR
jgi:hypothetical protein